MKKQEPSIHFEEVAIIGLAGRFPGARDVEQFWRNLRDGVESISFFSNQELEASGVSPEVYERPDYVRAKGVCDDVEMFDASFFGLTPREAEIMDPQHRLFLECSWEALENAGYNFEEQSGRIGVFAGSSMSTYLLVNLLSNPELFEKVNGLQARIMNDKDFLTTHVSYKLNLKGPSVAVQTACSTALVAVHLACQQLLDGECDMALAGGITLRFPYKTGYLYQEGGIWSADGHCRAFDAGAQGTVEGNGAGVVVLKRLSDAVASGDYIHAVIKGSAVNNDGSHKINFTAPSVESQTRVVAEALALAGIESETISYVEAHGSGTPLGDPIEIESLIAAFDTERKNFCAIGSVKTNIGHLDNAAGIASLIKTVQALKYKIIPPSLHFKTPSSQLNLSNSPFYVNTKRTEWRAGNIPRRAGVTSLGIGGTNAHVILEEAPEQTPAAETRPCQLLLLSAKTSSALERMTANLADHLEQNPELNLADVAYTLQVGRRQFNRRRALVCGNLGEAVAALKTVDPRRVLTGSPISHEPSVAFMFPGLGDQHVGMASELYQFEPSFRAQIERCSELLKPHLNLDLRDVLYPRELLEARQNRTASEAALSSSRSPDLRKILAPRAADEDEATRKLNQTYLAQPAVFVIEYALAQLMMELGIHPQAMIGYSIGEYVAACLAGVFSLETALKLVAERARMIQGLPGGAMLAVPLPDTEVLPLFDHRLSLSACNGPSLSVVGGSREAVDALERRLEEQGIVSLRLQTSHAFHSQMMEPIIRRFAQQVAEIDLKPPRIPFISNVTGTWITEKEATDPNYWALHMRHTVRFTEGLEKLLSEPKRLMLEVGPGQSLSTLTRQHPSRRAEQVVLACLRDRRDEVSDEFFLLNTVGQLWLAGCRVDWREGYSAREQRHRLPLPHYPFERQRYWVEAGRLSDSSMRNDPRGKKADLSDWFYFPIWKQSSARTQLKKEERAGEKKWLIFLDELGLGSRMAERLAGEGQVVVSVKAGESFAAPGENLYTINPSRREDYDTLMKELFGRGMMPHVMMHLWSITPDGEAISDLKFDEHLQSLGFYSLLFLAQALGEQGIGDPINIGVVSNHLHDVVGEELLCPQKATLWGACKVIPQEYRHLTCRSIDIRASSAHDASNERIVKQLIEEMTSASINQAIAYRGQRRWIRDFEAVRLEPQPRNAPRLRDGGTYLITGGLTEPGLMIAEHIARTARAKLALVAGADFPPHDKWEKWLSAHDETDQVSRQIRRVRTLQASGCELLVFTADVANEEQMKAVVKQTCERFGEINGAVNATGITSAGIIQLKTVEMASAALTLKVKGTLVLASLIKDFPLDFFVLFSSTTSIAGGFGQVELCAANAFLDALARQYSLNGNGFTVSINWSPFQWDTWQLPSAGTTAVQSQLDETLQTYGLSAEEGREVFNRVLSADSPQVIVSPNNFQTVIAQTDRLTAASFLDALRQSKTTEGHRRPDLSVSYVPPTSEVEQVVATIWQEAFGVEKIGTLDNFFDLAGNSLLAIQIVTRLRNAFNVKLPMTALFTAPTVAQLAQKIEEARHLTEESEEIDLLLSEIEALSLDEAEKRLAEELGASE